MLKVETLTKSSQKLSSLTLPFKLYKIGIRRLTLVFIIYLFCN